MSTETVFVNLEVLSKLREGQKLRVKRHRFWQLYNEESGIYRWVPEGVRRWLDASSRHTDLTTIIDTYEAAMSAADHLRREPQRPAAESTRKSLVELMARSLAGLKMMQRTYSEDATMVSRVAHLVNRITACVEEHGVVASEQLKLVMLDELEGAPTSEESALCSALALESVQNTDKKIKIKKKKDKH